MLQVAAVDDSGRHISFHFGTIIIHPSSCDPPTHFFSWCVTLQWLSFFLSTEEGVIVSKQREVAKIIQDPETKREIQYDLLSRNMGTFTYCEEYMSTHGIHYTVSRVILALVL